MRAYSTTTADPKLPDMAVLRAEPISKDLLGEPILVLAARLTYEATPATSPGELASTPPAMPAPPAMPVLSVRLGDSTRPDDGTLGCFIAGATDGEGRFAPVTVEAAEKAILNGLALGVPFFVGSSVKVTHAFVKDQQTLFGVAHGVPSDRMSLAMSRMGPHQMCIEFDDLAR